MTTRRTEPAWISMLLGPLTFSVSWHPKVSGPQPIPPDEPRPPGVADAFATAHALARAGANGDRDGAVRLTDDIRDRGDIAEAAATLGVLAYVAGEIARSVPPAERPAMWERIAAIGDAVDEFGAQQ